MVRPSWSSTPLIERTLMRSVPTHIAKVLFGIFLLVVVVLAVLGASAYRAVT